MKRSTAITVISGVAGVHLLVFAACRVSPDAPVQHAAAEPASPPQVEQAPRTQPAPSQPRAAPEEPLRIAVRGHTQTAALTNPRDFLSGATLASGDYFVLHVWASKPAYVTVVQFFAGGRREVLFPDTDAEQMPGGVDSRIPTAPEKWFQLDQAVGSEYLYVIASLTPLKQSDPELASAIDDVRVSPDPASSAPPPPKAARRRTGGPPRPPPTKSNPWPPPASPTNAQPEVLPLRAKGVKKVVLPTGVTAYQAAEAAGPAVVATFEIRH